MTPAEWLAAQPKFDGGVPEAPECAALHFTCDALAQTLSGDACARRHRQAQADEAYEVARSARSAEMRGRGYYGKAHEACLNCKAGAARLRLLDPPPPKYRRRGEITLGRVDTDIGGDMYIKPEGWE